MLTVLPQRNPNFPPFVDAHRASATRLSRSSSAGSMRSAASLGLSRSGSFVAPPSPQALGLAPAPNTGNNCVHASASPFEGFAERTNWLKDAYTFAADPFGKLCLDAGISEATLKAWSVDPQVLVEGTKGSLFDAVEDLDTTPCLAKLAAISAENSK